MPVSVHRDMSMSGTCWGCDSVCMGMENGHVHPMYQPHFGFPQPKARRAVLQGQCLLRSCGCGCAFPQQGHQTLTASAHSSPRLGTQFSPPPWQHQFSSWAPITSYLHGVPMGRVSFVWELCSSLAGYSCVSLLLSWEGGPGKAQAHWALSKHSLPQFSLFSVMGAHSGARGLCLGAGNGGWQAVPLQAPTIPQPPQPTPGRCLCHKQLPSSW